MFSFDMPDFRDIINTDIMIKSIINRLNELSASKERVIAAIDGRCAAGKSSLAAALQIELGCAVFHMDDFYLRREQRTEERFAEPGGNVDRERFYDEILSPLLRGDEEIVYRPFSCITFELTEPRSVKAGDVIIIEGSYSCHPELWEYSDLHIFLTLSPDEQMRRIIRREGEKKAEMFKNRWIPFEERYFEAYHIEERCEMRFDTGLPEP